MRRANLARATVLTALSAISCSAKKENRGGVILHVSHDLDAPLVALDRLTVTVNAYGVVIDQWDYLVPHQRLLPNTIGIVSNGDASLVVRVVVSGFRKAADGSASWVAVDRRDAILTHVPSDRIVDQSIVLSARCEKQVHTARGEAVSRCTESSDETTCNPQTGGCMDAHLPRRLEAVTDSSDAASRDAGPSDGPERDAVDDVSAESGAKADVYADVSAEQRLLDASAPTPPPFDVSPDGLPAQDGTVPEVDADALAAAAATPDGAQDAERPADASSDVADADGARDATRAEASVDTGEREDSDGGVEAAPDALPPEAGPARPPSCRERGEGRDDCGPRGTESCCTSHRVVGERFDRSNEPLYPATISDLFLDKYEITVGRFRSFTRAWVAGWRPPSGSGKHVHLNGGNGLVSATAAAFEPGWSDADTAFLPATAAAWDASLLCDPNFGIQPWVQPGNEQRPMNCINWYDAYAFCIWDGGFLPSEAEWNFAAAGGARQNVYPWSSPPFQRDITPSYASYSLQPTVTCDGDGVSSCDITDLIKVGTKPMGNGRFGQADMSGNVWEWTLDAYADDYAPGDCIDCANVSAQPNRVTRGGALGSSAEDLLTTFRDEIAPTTRVYYIGARCARTPP